MLGRVEKLGNFNAKQSDISVEEIQTVTLPKEEIPEEYSFEWGDGFELKDYEYLEREIEVWKRTHKCDNEAEETLLKEICLTKLGLRKSRASNDDTRVKDLTKNVTRFNENRRFRPFKIKRSVKRKTTRRFRCLGKRY